MSPEDAQDSAGKGGGYGVLRRIIEIHLGTHRSLVVGHAPQNLHQVHALPIEPAGSPDNNHDAFAITRFPD